MIVSRSAYLDGLKGRVSEEEREALENGGPLLISRYNRETLLRMLRDGGGAGTVDTLQADALEKTLEAYLAQYMAEQPSGHKWIILSCLYLSQVAGEPMHPQPMARWRREGGAYYCPAREDQSGSVCLWCVCRREGPD